MTAHPCLPRRYVPLRLLGEGGMGTVFLVRDRREERELALKVCRIPAGPDEWGGRGPSLDRFRREFLALSGLSHPGIPRVHDFGWLPGRGKAPRGWFFTYEPARGEDLLAWSRGRSTVELLAVARRLIETLSFLHARGILHLDVKPSNIIVDDSTGQPQPRLIDFGIVREGKQIGGIPCLGSLPYMAPELIRGEPVGPAADLFSLGVTLHECFFGVRPYAGGSIDEIRRQHGQLPPIPRHRHPEERNRAEAGSGKLQGLIWRLLSRDPQRRLLDVPGESSAASGAFSAYVLGNRPVGLQDILEALFGAYEAVTRGIPGPTIVVVEGEAGSGKTRVLAELEDMVQVAGGRFIRIAPRRPGGSGNPWMQALLEALIEVAGSRSSAARSLMAGEADREDRPLDEGEYARAREDQARVRRFESFLDLVALAARGRPLVIAFDDVHTCDEDTLGLIEYLARNLHLLHLERPGSTGKKGRPDRSSAPALLCATYRPEEARRALAGGEPHARRLGLAPLTPAQVGNLLSSLFVGKRIRRDLVKVFHGSSRGNPFVLIETLKTLLEEKSIVYRPAEGLEVREPPESWRLPRTVEGLLLSRWKRLPARERKLAACLSACPGDILPAEALELSPFPPAETTALLEGLSRRLVAVRAESSREGRLAFAHPRLRDIARKSLSRGAAPGIHRKLALLRERAGAPSHELALHFAAAGDAGAAARHAAAAEPAPGETPASSGFGAMYEAVLSILPPLDGRRLPLSVKLAEIRSLAGDHRAAVRILEGALRAAPDAEGPSGIAPCLLLLASERVLLADLGGARRDYEKLEQMLRGEPGSWQVAIRARLGLARVELESGNPTASLEIATECLRLVEETGGRGEEPDRLRSIVLSRIGSLHAAQGRHDEAIESYSRSEMLLRRHPYSIEKGGLSCNLANLHRACGRLDAALRHYRRARVIAERIRARDLQALVQANLGVLHLDRWELPRAAQALRASLRLAESTGARRYITFARLCTGTMLSRRGDLDEAIHLLEGERRRCRKEGDEYLAASASFLLVKPCLDRGSMARARAAARAGLSMARRIRRPRSILEGELALAVVALHLGDSVRAIRILEKARRTPAGHHPQIDAEILLHLGLARLESGRALEGERDLREAAGAFAGLKIGLRAGEARHHLALALATLGRREEASRLSAQVWQAFTRIPREERPLILWAEVLTGRASLFASGILDGKEELHDLLHELNEIREVLLEKKVERLRWQVTAGLGRLHELIGDHEAARALLREAGEELDLLARASPGPFRARLLALRETLAPREATDPAHRIPGEANVEPGAPPETAALRERLLRLEASHTSLLEENRRLRLAAEALSSRVATRRFDRAGELERNGSHGRESFQGLVGRSVPMLRLYALLEKVALTDIPILLRGETGTGKDLAARAIHRLSRRRAGPFVAETLSALPEGLLESELFGYAEGAFSGAAGEREGLLVSSNGGTLYLADIAEPSLEVQAKIVRVLESTEVRPLGASEGRKLDFRLVTSTQVDLERAAAEGRFRRDLLFRVRGIEIVLPPLRERRDDIPLLIEHFLEIEAGRSQAQIRLEPDAQKRLVEHDWPGNVRELENEIRRLAILGSGRIRAADLALPPPSGPDLAGAQLLRPGVLERFSWSEVREALERAHFEAALQASGGKLRDMARRLGVHPRTIAKMRKRLGGKEG